jgi:hypothetical protein
LTYSITWDKKIVYCKFSGEVSGQELAECNMAMYGNANLDNTKFQVFDMLDATKFTFMKSDVIKVAAFDRAAAKIWPSMKCALVSTNQIALELSKVYQNEIHDSPWEGRSFQTINDALEWFSQP